MIEREFKLNSMEDVVQRTRKEFAVMYSLKETNVSILWEQTLWRQPINITLVQTELCFSVKKKNLTI